VVRDNRGQGKLVTSTGVVLDGVAPPVELMTCSITPTPPRETVQVVEVDAGAGRGLEGVVRDHGRVVEHLVLEENGLAAVAVPLRGCDGMAG
jgi:hypothetical protein